MNNTVVVVCPVYWDAESFRRLHGEVVRFLRGRADKILFRVVDDSAGQDPDAAGLESLEDTRVLTVPFNVGHQRALVYALRKLAAELDEDAVVVTMDADGEDKPEDLPRLIERLTAPPFDSRRVVLARRTRRKETLAFKVLYFFFKIAFRLLTGTVIRSGNYAAFYGWATKRFLNDPRFNFCYSSTLAALPTTIEQVPCERGSRYAGRSRMGYLNLVKHGMRMLMPFLDVITIRALVFFFVVFVGGMLSGALALGARLLKGTPIPGWAIYSLLGTFVFSLIALGNALVLFLLFTQSQFLALASLESYDPAPAPTRKTGDRIPR